MKIKLLLLIFSFFLIGEGAVAAGKDATRLHIRIKIGSTPEQTPTHFPENVPVYTNMLYVSFDKMEDFALITVTNKTTGEVTYSKVHFNIEKIAVNLSSFPKGEYLLEVLLDDIVITRTIWVE